MEQGGSQMAQTMILGNFRITKELYKYDLPFPSSTSKINKGIFFPTSNS